MAYTTIKYGASGDDVKTLQNYLNQNGYNLSADGQFGAKTQAAVKDYQNKNGLIADGIVGTNTWKSFGNSTQNNTVNKNTVLKSTSSATTNKENVRPTYSASKEVSSAQKALEEWEGKKPQEYKSQYSGDINTLLDSILNGEKFSYDTADDELYKIYKEQYQNQGKLSMQNTVAQSAELTGGYGSSYGTAAGQQAYQQYLTELNNIIPELRDRAYQQYQDERTGKIQNLSLLQQQDDSAYSRYRDGVDDYNTQLSYLYQKTNDISDRDWQKYLQLVDSYEYDKAFDYQKSRDAISDAQWQKEYELSKQTASKSSSGSSSSRSSSGTSSSSSKNSSGGSSSGKKPTVEMVENVKAYANDNDLDGATEYIENCQIAGYDITELLSVVDRIANKDDSSDSQKNTDESNLSKSTGSTNKYTNPISYDKKYWLLGFK